MDAAEGAHRSYDHSGNCAMKFTTSDGLSLAYDDAGTGVPVLCLCGLTRNMSDFDDVAAQIGDRVRLIRMDYRGRGASDYAEDYSTYSIPVEARDALELLDHLGLDKALILGTSRGGLIGMLLAMLAKDRLLGVILNDIGPKLEEEGLTQIMGFLGFPGFRVNAGGSVQSDGGLKPRMGLRSAMMRGYAMRSLKAAR